MNILTSNGPLTGQLDLSWVRSQFPSLSRVLNGHPAAFLDGPGGTQVPQTVIDAISHYLKASNANTHGQYATSRAIGRALGPGDEILLTHLDHSANVSPWQALEERGVKIQFADIREDDCTLDMDDIARKLSPRTKVVAVGYASNAVGTINDVK